MYIYQSKAMFCLFARALVRAGRLKRTKWGIRSSDNHSIHSLPFLHMRLRYQELDAWTLLRTRDDAP
jgi:hypothetical protein